MVEPEGYSTLVRVEQRKRIVVAKVQAAGWKMLTQHRIHRHQRIVTVASEVLVGIGQGRSTGAQDGMERKAKLVSQVVEEQDTAAVSDLVDIAA